MKDAVTVTVMYRKWKKTLDKFNYYQNETSCTLQTVSNEKKPFKYHSMSFNTEMKIGMLRTFPTSVREVNENSTSKI